MAKRVLVRSTSLILALTVGGCAGGSDGSPPVGSLDAALRSPSQPTSVAASTSTTQPLLIVADLSNVVSEYTASLTARNPMPFASITRGINRAEGVWIDKNGTLYVSNNGGSQESIVEYKRGSSVPFKTITKGFYIAGDPAVDSAGNLYVTDSEYNGSIHVYPPGASTPARTIIVPYLNHGGLGSLGFDPKGDLIFAQFSVESNIAVAYSVAPGSTKAINLDLKGLPGNVVGTDAAGNIYVGGIEGTIAVYKPGSKTPARYINAQATGFYSEFAVTPNGTIYWPNYDDGEMYEFAPGASGPTNVFLGARGIDAAVGVY